MARPVDVGKTIRQHLYVFDRYFLTCRCVIALHVAASKIHASEPYVSTDPTAAAYSRNLSRIGNAADAHIWRILPARASARPIRLWTSAPCAPSARQSLATTGSRDPYRQTVLGQRTCTVLSCIYQYYLNYEYMQFVFAVTDFGKRMHMKNKAGSRTRARSATQRTARRGSRN